MAPYVELEWGAKATEVMWELKGLFDPDNLLNPGVVLNKDPKVHTHNLKPLPVAHGIVDACMECGFCESACPSGNVSLYIYVCVCVYIYISVYYVYLSISIYMYVCMYLYRYTDIWIHPCMRTYRQACVLACIHAHTRTHTHTGHVTRTPRQRIVSTFLYNICRGKYINMPRHSSQVT